MDFIYIAIVMVAGFWAIFNSAEWIESITFGQDEEMEITRKIDSARRMSIFKKEEQNVYGHNFYHDDEIGS